MVQAVLSPARVRSSAPPKGPTASSIDRNYGDVPLAGLAGSDLDVRFRHWLGGSGRRYLFSVFPLSGGQGSERSPRYEDAVVLAVTLAEDGTRRMSWIGQTGSMPDLVFDGDGLRRAVEAGANEIHVHLLAKDQASRDAVVRDIAG